MQLQIDLFDFWIDFIEGVVGGGHLLSKTNVFQFRRKSNTNIAQIFFLDFWLHLIFTSCMREKTLVWKVNVGFRASFKLHEKGSFQEKLNWFWRPQQQWWRGKWSAAWEKKCRYSRYVQDDLSKYVYKISIFIICLFSGMTLLSRKSALLFSQETLGLKFWRVKTDFNFPVVISFFLFFVDLLSLIINFFIFFHFDDRYLSHTYIQ